MKFIGNASRPPGSSIGGMLGIPPPSLLSLVVGPNGALRRPPATHGDRHGEIYSVHSLEKKPRQIDSHLIDFNLTFSFQSISNKRAYAPSSGLPSQTYPLFL